MRTIHKYVLPAFGADSVTLVPVGSIIRLVAMQGLALCVWIEVDTEHTTIGRVFRVFGTGHQVPDGYTYVGTAFDREFVWHVFEKRSAETRKA